MRGQWFGPTIYGPGVDIHRHLGCFAVISWNGIVCVPHKSTINEVAGGYCRFRHP